MSLSPCFASFVHAFALGILRSGDLLSPGTLSHRRPFAWIAGSGVKGKQLIFDAQLEE